MNIRQAVIKDIPQIQLVRNTVKENQLSDPSLVPDKDVEDYMTRRGKGWVCEMGNRIVGFAIVSVTDRNVWALFIEPGHEKKGIGRLLHDEMMNWYFSQTRETIWLGTAPGTRAARFYQAAGWSAAGLHGKGEIKFEMSCENWQQLNP